MNTCRCCAVAASDSCSEPVIASTTHGEVRRSTFARRVVDIAGWMVPGAIMAILPKCPACLAGYVAVWTGLGLSLQVAAGLRWSLLILCVASMLYLAVRLLHRFAVAFQGTKRNPG